MEKKNYDINIFCPKTKFAKINTKLIIISVLIWAVAVFGFQISLKVLEKPVPEKAYLTFTKVWDKIHSNSKLTMQDRADISKVYLTLMGKYVKNRKNHILKGAFSLTVNSMAPQKKTSVTAKEAAALLGLSSESLLAKVIPHVLIPKDQIRLSNEEVRQIPVIAKKYLVHKRSVLTDTKFLGFPFHYFYTAVFLLVLFVGLCWIYCFIIQKTTKELGINEDES
ncbi:DUF4212 domain-containing protein [Candidatus Margulisiibacteriota bacterium]